jgi:hypothetical protein
MRALIIILALIMPTFANGQSATTPIGHEQPQETLMPTHRASIRVGTMQWGFLTKHPLITFGSCLMAGQSR